MNKAEIISSYDKYILSTYTRTPGVFVKGKGMVLRDVNGMRFLDFFPGWGVNNVGHCHPKVMGGVRDQVSKLIHIPNNFYHPHQAKLAKEIIRCSFPGKVFFCNSGTEACEAAIKFSRVYGKKNGRYEIITMQNSFHGRTLGALAATGQPKYQEGFEPLPQGFQCVPFNDFKAAADAVTDKTAAIMLELVQGEGGINIADKEYVRHLRELCDRKDILLIFDEVQTGMGRTGTMFAFEQYGVTPDLMLLAKALGGGLPIGALIVKSAIAGTFQPGMHASTFGGSPLVCKAALGTFKAIIADKMLRNAQVMGKYLLESLGKLKQQFSCITDVRGMGLMIGVELNIAGKDVYNKCFERGLIINCTQENILRLMPALNVTKKQADKAVYMLEEVLKEVTQK
ncbi:MAG: acetylornithine aminotransferase [Omnitrophica WOR_2 bacterium RIFCSPHIGHO2_02_FULL_52_10]|nr:MAG: acetylornithine aminotransferase [Omnitrophica WOR_2 bacterium RIFCSPHIGHO2_02_FULL_52_10]